MNHIRFSISDAFVGSEPVLQKLEVWFRSQNQGNGFGSAKKIVLSQGDEGDGIVHLGLQEETPAHDGTFKTTRDFEIHQDGNVIAHDLSGDTPDTEAAANPPSFTIDQTQAQNFIRTYFGEHELALPRQTRLFCKVPDCQFGPPAPCDHAKIYARYLAGPENLTPIGSPDARSFDRHRHLQQVADLEKKLASYHE